MTSILDNFGIGSLLAPKEPQETTKKESWNLAKAIGRDIF